jgi:hypothetical protein
MGVYKRIEDVPNRYRLSNYEAAYAGRDVWGEFFDEKTAKFDTQSTLDRYEKAGRYLQTFMSDVGRHHALATPQQIEDFLVALRDGEIGRQSHTRKLQTVYFEYFQPVEEFYTWLEWHTDHKHVYHPVLMAVVEGGYAREVWNRKLEQNDKR